MLEKTNRMNALYDFYHVLLTPKQKAYMVLYYLEDLSLGEIAEQYDVSRQAVYDNIKRTEAMLEKYEEKLQLYEKFHQRQRLLDELVELVKDRLDEDTEEKFTRILHQLKDLD